MSSTNNIRDNVYTIIIHESKMLCGTSGGEICVFDLAEVLDPNWSRLSTPTSRFAAHQGSVYGLCLVADAFVLSVGDDGYLRVWSWADLQSSTSKPVPKHEFTAPSLRSIGKKPEYNCVSLDSQTGYIYVGCGDSAVYSWDLSSFAYTGRLVGHKDYIHALTFANGALYTASEDGTVRVWDTRDSTPCRATLTLPNSMAYLSSLAVSDDSHWLAAGGGAGVVGVWHAPSQRLSTSLSHDSTIGAVTFAARGEVGQRAVSASTSSSGASLVVGVCGGGLSHWQLDGTLRMRVSCAPSCVYSIALGRSTGYEMLAVGGSCGSIDAFFGDYAAAAARFQVS